MDNIVAEKSYKHFLIYQNDSYTNEMEKIFKNPDIAFDIPDDLLLKNGNSATLVKFTIDKKEYVVKRYNMKTRMHALRRAFKKTRASHSWKYSHLLKKKGIKTPNPVAFKEKRLGPFRNKAFFICEYVKGLTAFDYFNDPQILFENKALIAKKITQIFDTLKFSLISHGDMKATNIIINENDPHLIDLDSMKKHRSKYFFKRAWEKDMNRFMKNWDDLPEISQLFRQVK